MSEQDSAPPPGQAGLTMEEAAIAMGVSLNTMRRWCRTGRVRSERIDWPQGYMVRVYLDQVPKQGPPLEGAEQEPPIASGATRQEPPPHQPHVPDDQTRAEAMVSLIQTTIGTVLGPLVAEQAALRQTVERQAGEIAELREDRGRLTAENEALRVAQVQRGANPGPEAPNPTTEAPVSRASHLRALASWVPMLVMLALAVVTLLLTLALLALT